MPHNPRVVLPLQSDAALLFDLVQLASLGMAAFISYGVVSNVT